MDSERHVGDLGNLKTDEKGNAYLATTDTQIKLFGEDSVVGRSCVVHAGEDDLGRGGHKDSSTTGNSGARVACGVIALSADFKNLPPK
jgi:Cu-Zn family superoxide dismutase